MLFSERKHEIMQRSTASKLNYYGCDCIAYNFSITEIVIPEQQCSTSNPQLESCTERFTILNYVVLIRHIRSTQR